MTRILDKCRRGLSLLLVLCLLASLLTLPAGAADPLARFQGSGTQRAPYLITSAEDLMALRDWVNTAAGTQQFAYWRQAADIDLSAEANWTPIGKMVQDGVGSSIYRFSGEYDGDGYAVTGLTITSAGAEAVGLFGNVSRAVIRDLTVSGSIVHTNAASHSANYGVGGIAGRAVGLYDPDITNPDSSCAFIGCTSLVNIQASSMVGGICGDTQTDVRFENCAYGGAIVLSMQSQYSYDVYGTGGILGISQGNDVFTGCYNSGSISCVKGDVSLGGIVGYAANGADTTISKCYNTGAISCATTSGSTGVGGIVGKRTNGYGADADEAMKMSIRDCFNLGQLTAADGGTTGGIVGRCVSAAVDGSPIWTESNLSHVYALKGTADYVVRGVTLDGKVRNCPGESDTAEMLRYQEDMAEELGDAFVTENGALLQPWQASTARYNVTFVGYDGATGETIPVRVDLDYEYGLAPGRYTYTASKNGYNAVTGSFGIVSSDKTVYVTLQPAAYRYTLRVSPADTVVTLTTELGEVSPAEKSAGDGWAEYIFDVNANIYGDYTLRLAAFGYVEQVLARSDEFTEEFSERIDLAPAQTYPVTFTVQDGTGAAVTPRVLRVTDDRFGAAPAAEADGSFLLPDGSYTVTVMAEGYKQLRQSFAVNGGAAAVPLTLTKDAWAGESDTAWFTGTSDRYEIYTTAELAGLAQLVNGGESFAGATVALGCDLDLNGAAWTPIGSSTVKSFQGTFDGQGHTIGGLTINRPRAVFDDFYEKYKLVFDGHAGLFGYVSGAVVENVTLDLASGPVDLDWYRENYDLMDSTSALSFAGGAAAFAVNTTFRGVAVRGALNTEGNYIGGLVGEAKGCAFLNCENRASVSGSFGVGGVAGQADGACSFAAAANYGAVTGYFSKYMSNKAGHGVGGLIGRSTTTAVPMVRCVNLGAVRGNSMLGGLVGVGSVRLTDCYNGGAVTITGDEVTVTAATVDEDGNPVAAVMGVQDGLYAGGLVGYGGSLTAENCYDRAPVTDESGEGCVVRALAGYTESADVRNVYYAPALSDELGAAADEGALDALAATLGGAYCPDTDRTNGGYPVLTWQRAGSTYTVTFPASYDREENLGRGLTITVNGAAIIDGQAQLPRGYYTYTAEQEGYAPVSGSFDVTGADTQVPVALTAETYLYRFLTDGTVTLRKDGAEVAPAETTAEGPTYRLYNGTYSYMVTKQNCLPVTGEITVAFSGGSRTVALTPADTYAVRFEVTADGAGFYDWTAAVTDEAGQLCGTLTAGDTLDLMDGTYHYTVSAQGYRDAAGTFTVNGGALTVQAALVKKTAAVWDGTADTAWYTAGVDSYSLYTAEELAGLAQLVNAGTSFAGTTLYLMNDLDLGAGTWTAIGTYAKPFSGVFDGQGHTIASSGSLAAGDMAAVGLFGYAKGAELKNLVLAGDRTAAASYDKAIWNASFGGLVGWAADTAVTNVANRGSLSVTAAGTAQLFAYVGGLAGKTDNVTFTACNNIGGVSAAASSTGSTAVVTYVGGVAGQLSGGMAGCYNSGRVLAGSSYMCRAGGLAGGVSGAPALSGNYAVGAVDTQTAETVYLSALFAGYDAPAENYYLSTLTAQGGTAKTAAELQAEDFAGTLGSHFRYTPGAYPMNEWEAGAQALTVSRLPNKVDYNDIDAFDDTGMELTVTYASGAQAVVTGGWVVVNGESLAAGQTEVIVTYMGKRAAVPVTVTQVTHTIPDSQLEFSLKAPRAGETGGQIALIDWQADRFDAQVTWMQGGNTAAGPFEENTYYYAKVRLTISAEAATWYAFARDARPTVPAGHEVLAARVSEDGKELTFLVTYSLGGPLTDEASHLYYEGIDPEKAAPLDSTLTITLNGETWAKYTLRQLETMALAGCGAEENGCTGLPLYTLLNEIGRMDNLADDGTVTIGTKTLTAAQLRADKHILLAYGMAGQPLDGLALVSEGETLASGMTAISVAAARAGSFTAVFRAENAPADMKLTLWDSFDNLVYTGPLGAVTLRQGEVYRYQAQAAGYAAVTGTVARAETVTVPLVPGWDGTYRQPSVDAEENYLITCAEELAWFHQQCTGVSQARSKEMCGASVKLLADVSMAGYDWTPIAPTESARTLYYPAAGMEIYCGGQYSGTFDGNGHTIYDLNVTWTRGLDNTNSRMDALGLFGYLRGGTVRDLGVKLTLNVEDESEYGGDWLAVGGIAGFAQTGAQISGCYADVDMNVTVRDASPELNVFAGGIVGALSSPLSQSTVENCYSTGSIRAAGNYAVYLGGIAGTSRSGSSKVTRCWSDATLSARPGSGSASYVGGIIGMVGGVTASALPEVSYCFALNPLLDGGDAALTTAGRVVGYGQRFGNEGSYNYGLDTMVLQNAAKTDYDQDDSGYRSGWGRDITRQAAWVGDTYTNVLWNMKEIVSDDGETDYEEDPVWDFSGYRQYPRFLWQAGSAPEGETYAVTVDDRTGGRANIGLTDGDYAGTLSFTVDCPAACVVLVTEDGTSYAALPASPDGGAYRFTLASGGDRRVLVALKGDVDLSGSLNSADAAKAKRFAAGLETATALEKLILGTEKITGITALRLQRAVVGLYDQAW